MIARRNAQQTFSLRTAVMLLVRPRERADIARPSLRKIWLFPEQGHIVSGAVVQKKIHVKSRLNRLLRIPPLGNQYRLRIVRVQKPAHFLPETLCTAVPRICFHKTCRHIHAETVTPQLQPERHDILEKAPPLLRLRGICRRLPRLCHISEPVIQRRLRAETVHRHSPVAVRHSPEPPADPADVSRVLHHTVRPDKTLCVCILLRTAGRLKPRGFQGSMPCHQIQKDVHAAAVNFLKQLSELLIGPVARRRLIKIRHVIARVIKRGFKTGIHPDGITSQIPDIIQPSHNPPEIPDPVPVGVLEGLGVNLIKNCIVKPICHMLALLNVFTESIAPCALRVNKKVRNP